MVGYRVLRCSAKQMGPFIGGRGLFCFEFDIVTFIRGQRLFKAWRL